MKNFLFYNISTIYNVPNIILTILALTGLIVLYLISLKKGTLQKNLLIDEKQRSKQTTLQWIIVAIILILTFFTMIYNIGNDSFSNQEMLSLEFASVATNFFDTVFFFQHLYTFHQPVNTYLVKFLSIFSTNEIFLRVPSAIFILIFSLYIFRSIKLLSPNFNAYTAMIFGAISPVIIFYSRSIEAYSLFIMLAAMQIYYFLRLFYFNKNKKMFIAASVIGFFNHYFFISLFFSEILFLFILFIMKKINFKEFLYYINPFAIIGFPIALWIPVMVQAFVQGATIINRQIGQIYYPNFNHFDILWKMLKVFSGNDNFVYIISFYILVIGVIIFQLFIKKREIYILYTILFFTAIIVVLITQYITMIRIGGTFPITFRHHIYFLIPIITIIFSVKLDDLLKFLKPIYVIILLAVIIVPIEKSYGVITLRQRPDYKGFADIIKLDYIEASDAIVFPNYLYLPPMRFYMKDNLKNTFQSYFYKRYFTTGMVVDLIKGTEYRTLRPNIRVLKNNIETENIKRLWLIFAEEYVLGELSYTQQLEYIFFRIFKATFPEHKVIKSYILNGVKASLVEL